MKKVLAITIAISALTVGLMATAADEGPHDKAIKARQGVYQILGHSIAELAAMAKEKTPYDAEAASRAANNLYMATKFDQSTWWPMGSDNATEGNTRTRALPDIWQNFPDVIEKGKALDAAAENMAAEAGKGLAALQGAMGDLGKSCKGCHDDYRAKKK